MSVHCVRRLRTWKFVLILTAVLLTATTAAATASAAALNGVGSTMILPLEGKWASVWSSTPGNAITYTAGDHMTGFDDVENGTVDFESVYSPFEPEVWASCQTCVMIPLAVGAVAVPFHVGALKQLNLTGNVLADIYLGKITVWNDPQIKQLNPGVKLPKLKIIPIYETQDTGGTYLISSYLARESTRWRNALGAPAVATLPSGVMRGRSRAEPDDSAVVRTVKSINGAIGYAVSWEAAQLKLPIAALANRASKFESPYPLNVEAAARSVKTVKDDGTTAIVDPAAKFKLAYPLSAFLYAIARHDDVQAALLQSFLTYTITAGQIACPLLDFGQLPPSITSEAKAEIATL